MERASHTVNPVVLDETLSREPVRSGRLAVETASGIGWTDGYAPRHRPISVERGALHEMAWRQRANQCRTATIVQ